MVNLMVNLAAKGEKGEVRHEEWGAGFTASLSSWPRGTSLDRLIWRKRHLDKDPMSNTALSSQYVVF
jgi:hypothetical protein